MLEPYRRPRLRALARRAIPHVVQGGVGLSADRFHRMLLRHGSVAAPERAARET